MVIRRIVTQSPLSATQWTVEEAEKRAPRADTKTSKLSHQLIEFLDTYKGDRISVRALKVDTGLEDVHRNTSRAHWTLLWVN
jgi:hypothetical protein